MSRYDAKVTAECIHIQIICEWSIRQMNSAYIRTPTRECKSEFSSMKRSQSRGSRAVSFRPRLCDHTKSISVSNKNQC